MATAIVTPNQDAIVSEIHIAAPPERIFKALTDAGELQRWFGSPECPLKYWKMDAQVGGQYSYATEKGSIVVNGVSQFECHGEILECDPPRLLVYTWIGNWHDQPGARTIVRWELALKGTGTQVRVTHSGLANLPVAREDYAGGWPGVVEMLRKFVER
ncbi:MAG TPA: SRPBCC domain-containing protein [Dongiaceae bacterium]|nr:SRPBCC domain-containing protein [Dongiaceae bacterium]